jgi:hypothetical protein
VVRILEFKKYLNFVIIFFFKFCSKFLSKIFFFHVHPIPTSNSHSATIYTHTHTTAAAPPAKHINRIDQYQSRHQINYFDDCEINKWRLIMIFLIRTTSRHGLVRVLCMTMTVTLVTLTPLHAFFIVRKKLFSFFSVTRFRLRLIAARRCLIID